MYYSRSGTTLVTVVRVLLFIMIGRLSNGVLTELFLFTAVGLRYPRNYIRISYFRIYTAMLDALFTIYPTVLLLNLRTTVQVLDGGRFPKFATPTSNLLSRLLSRSTPQHGFIAFRITAIRKHEVGSGTALPITNFQKIVFTSFSERGAIVVNTISLLRGILIDHVVGCGSRRCPGWLLCRVMGYRWFWCFTPAAGTPGCSIAYHALSVRLMIKVTFHLV